MHKLRTPKSSEYNIKCVCQKCQFIFCNGLQIFGRDLKWSAFLKRIVYELLPNQDTDAFLAENDFSDIDPDLTKQMDQLEAESISKTTLIQHWLLCEEIERISSIE